MTEYYIFKMQRDEAKPQKHTRLVIDKSGDGNITINGDLEFGDSIPVLYKMVKTIAPNLGLSPLELANMVRREIRAENICDVLLNVL